MIDQLKFFLSDGDNTWGTATIRTSSRFDREERKYYYLPIVMWDRRDKANGSLTTTNTLTITIGDENDNVLAPGNQNILVYNYEGTFKILLINYYLFVLVLSYLVIVKQMEIQLYVKLNWTCCI